jgi:hypothetical protein
MHMAAIIMALVVVCTAGTCRMWFIRPVVTLVPRPHRYYLVLMPPAEAHMHPEARAALPAPPEDERLEDAMPLAAPAG